MGLIFADALFIISMNSIGIIGGGITGLTTAYGLKQNGQEGTLYEASSRVGGAVQSIRKDGFLAEFGPNTMLETSPVISSLVSNLGIENRKIYASREAKKRFVVRAGKPVAIPISPPGFFSTSLFSAGAKLRLFGEPFIGKSSPLGEESVAEFIRRRLGQEFLDYAIDPFVAGVYAGDAEKLSIRQAFPKLYALEDRYGSLIKGQIKGKRERQKSSNVSKERAKMFSFDEGLQVLIDSLFHRLSAEIKLNTSVTKIERTSGGWNLHYNDKGTEYINTHSSLILTIPAYKLSGLQHNIEGVDFSSLGEIYYPPVTSLALGFRREEVAHPLDGFGMLIPTKENFHILGTLFSSTLFSGRAPKDTVLLTSYLGGARQPELAGLSETEQVEIVLKDLRKLLGVRGEPVFINRTFFPKAIPQYNLSYGKYKDLMNQIEVQAPGLHFAGNFRNGISLSDCITAGSEMANKLSVS
jgi:oxygen-dependent protoporphyrinogen oxidase